MRIKVQIKCPACKFESSVAMKKPHLVQLTAISFNCSTCDCLIFAKVSRNKKDPKLVHIQTRLDRISEKMKAILKEEKEFNEAPQDSDDSDRGTDPVCEERQATPA